MKTDSIFYRIFLEFPQSFFELIGVDKSVVDNYKFTSREIKQTSFRIDGLFLPNNNEVNLPFYLVEVQFQPDDDLYYRLFSELFLFLKQYKPKNPWRIVVIYPKRSIEREQKHQFSEILLLNRVTRIYLDELGEFSEQYLGIKLVKLIIESRKQAITTAKSLINQANQQLTNEQIKRNFLDLIETIIVYKLPNKPRKEIEAMFSLNDLKQTKFYREAHQEDELNFKTDSIYRMLKLGLNLEIIANSLDLSIKEVQEIIAKQQSNN